MEKKIDELKLDEIDAVVGGVKTVDSKNTIILSSKTDTTIESSSSVSQLDASAKR